MGYIRRRTNPIEPNPNSAEHKSTSIDGSGTGVSRKTSGRPPLLPHPTICPVSLMANAYFNVHPESGSIRVFRSVIDEPL